MTRTTRRPAAAELPGGALPARPRRTTPQGQRSERTTDHGPRTRTRARVRASASASAFTLVELLIVIVVLGILIALLLPAINGALRSARNAAVSAEINQMSQALAQFKSTYGAYPPSRVLLIESGSYYGWTSNNSPVSSLTSGTQNSPGWAPAGGTGDITIGQLATRTLSALRRFWPKVQFSTNPNLPPNVANGNGNYWYDFNGNGIFDQKPYILQGHECLVFFLGGIPLPNPLPGTTGYSTETTFGMTGFGKDPTNPFTNSVNGSPMYNANRQTPLYQFNPGRLFLDPTNMSNASNSAGSPGIPGYYDSINNGPPTAPLTGQGPVGFYAYFSSYGNGNYDPNDVNFAEVDNMLNGPIELLYTVNFPLYGVSLTNMGTYQAVSPSPNPYTTTLTVGTVSTSATISYQLPQTFQIISSGADGLYGVGGQYVSSSQSSGIPLPVDTVNTKNTSDASIRTREYDNITNFKSGRLN